MTFPNSPVPPEPEPNPAAAAYPPPPGGAHLNHDGSVHHVPAPDAPTLEPFKRRNPWLWWFLGVVSFGVGFVVWHYQINRDLAESNPRRKVSPFGAAAALTVGGFVFIPPFVTVFNTTDRIRRAERDFGQKPSIGGGLSVFLYILFATSFVYQQYALNRLVDLREGVR